MRNNQTHFDILDILRGVAALCVFTHHYYQQFYLNTGENLVVEKLFIHLGAWGVVIFFALSGFCIQWARVNEIERHGVFSVSKFLIKRFFRIYPALIASVLVCYLVEFYYTSNLMPKSSIFDLFAHLTLTSSFFVGSRVAINNVLWSVVVECHFYMMYALLWRYFSNLKEIAGMVSIAILVSALVYVMSIVLVPSGVVRVTIQGVFLASWWTWCLGALIAQMIHGNMIVIKSVFWNQFFVLISFICSIAITYLPPPWDLQARRFLLPILASLFLYFLLRCNFNFSKYRVFIFIGLISYSLYLFHPLAILIGYHLAFCAPYTMVLTFILGLLFAYISYYLVETKGVAISKKFINV